MMMKEEFVGCIIEGERGYGMSMYSINAMKEKYMKASCYKCSICGKGMIPHYPYGTYYDRKKGKRYHEDCLLTL